MKKNSKERGSLKIKRNILIHFLVSLKIKERKKNLFLIFLYQSEHLDEIYGLSGWPGSKYLQQEKGEERSFRFIMISQVHFTSVKPTMKNHHFLKWKPSLTVKGHHTSMQSELSILYVVDFRHFPIYSMVSVYVLYIYVHISFMHKDY